MDEYVTLLDKGEYTFVDRKSEFIGISIPIKTEQEALDLIAYAKKKYPDARHWVYAYILKEGSIMRYSDDREPQGTAGLPVLDILRKREITDVAVVVVRYFGGTLLGTGGLVHAYSEAALGAVNNSKVIKYSLFSTVQFECGYSDYQKLIPIFDNFGFICEDSEFRESVIIKGRIEKKLYSSMIDEINDKTCKRVESTLISENFGYR